MKDMILQKCNFRCRENIYICRPLRRLRRLAVEYVKNMEQKFDIGINIHDLGIFATFSYDLGTIATL